MAMNKLRQVIFVLTLTSLVGFIAGQEYCYSEDEDKSQTTKFSTKTAYQIIKGVDRKWFNVPNCEAKRIWLYSRHGTRLPSAKSMAELRKMSDFRNVILENFAPRNRDRQPGQLCSEDLEALRNWRWDNNITDPYEDFLTVQGWNDLKFLAISYQKSFGNIIDYIYTRNRFKFAHSDTQRAEASFKAFAEGLFGPNSYNQITTDKDSQYILRPYDFCKSWEKNEEKSKDKNSEYQKFHNSDFYKQTLAQISTRLGFKYTLNSKQVDNIWDMCRYNQAWDLDLESAWCSAFKPEHVEVLEYAEDLKYFYKAGPGAEINSRVMCGAVQDMLQFIQSNDSQRVYAYFSHASGIQLLLTALGFNRDNENLRADNFFLMKDRKWRASVVSPFTSNLAVVTYDCPNEADPHKIQFFLNEKPVNDIKFCNIGLCDVSRVLEAYKEFLYADCSKHFCSGNSASYQKISTALLLVLAGKFIIFRLF